MSDYTPTTEEIEYYFANAHLVVHDGMEGDGVDKLRRWLAAEIRKAKAEAMKELSDKFESWGHEAIREIDLPIWIEDYADEKYPTPKRGPQ